MLGPIFARELVTVPRRRGHHAARCAVAGLLAILGITTWQATIGFSRDATLGETAAFGLLLFQIVVFVQLLLTLFFAALSAASAVSQEKDRRTFVLLLLTDMRDYEIVLGKLLGALLPITIQLMVTAPVLALLLFLGGIDPEQVIQAVLVLAASAAAAGSLGGLIALWRDKTYQAVALSMLFLVLYVCVVQGLGAMSGVQSWFDPFAAMLTVLEPPAGGWGGLAPAYGFVLVMLGWCICSTASASGNCGSGIRAANRSCSARCRTPWRRMKPSRRRSGRRPTRHLAPCGPCGTIRCSGARSARWLTAAARSW